MNCLEIFGDSILKGVLWSDEKQKYALAPTHHYDEIEKKGISVCNHSRMGATIGKGLSVLRRSDRFEPGTAVLLEYGGNDCSYDWQAVSDRPDDRHLPFTPEKEFLDEYRTAIRLARQNGAVVWMTNLIGMDAERYLGWISKDRSYDNIMKWLGSVDRLSEVQAHYNTLVEHLAEEEGCPLINLRSLFGTEPRDYLCLDGIHPNEAGHRLIAGKLAEFVKN